VVLIYIPTGVMHSCYRFVSDLGESSDEKVDTFIKLFNEEIIKMTTSNDTHAKKGGVLATGKCTQDWS